VTGLAVQAEGLGKRFQRTVPRHHTLIGRVRHQLLGDALPPSVWALKDLDLCVRRGECLGISGPNGAGKTTLLKLIAGILHPTEGSVRVFGSTNAFFQIGAGIQGELSVRDNIEISGILMGLSRGEVRGRMGAILGFSELAELADVRMAELSTGQAARVAFSTAIHSELDILLVDEVLAVGDAAFQEKCFAAFELLRAEGKTLLVASHDMGVLDRICTRGLGLRAGRSLTAAPAGEASGG